MNKQGEGKIGWTDYTWSPVTGCKNNCSYCYARKISHRFGRSFEPTFHPERLEEPYKLKKPSKIFVCSMGELFGPWVSRQWQEAILKVVRDNRRHTFQFLTKFPYWYRNINYWPPNAWLGTTLTSLKDWERHFDLARGGPFKVDPLGGKGSIRFVSIEPFLGSFSRPLFGKPSVAWLFDGIDWLIIGAQTNPNLQPEPGWLDELVAQADLSGTPVFIKANLDCPEPKRREFPRGGRDE